MAESTYIVRGWVLLYHPESDCAFWETPDKANRILASCGLVERIDADNPMYPALAALAGPQPRRVIYGAQNSGH